MKSLLLSLASFCCLQLLHAATVPVPLGDGKTFDDWEGDIVKAWRIEDGAYVGESKNADHNEFLATIKTYKNFDLRLKFKIEGTEGFVNGGVQIRSTRVPNSPEMCGYQADAGDAAYSGSLYDESRRNKFVAQAPKELITKVLKPQDWNDYRILCEGRRIQLWVNGEKMCDYTEADEALPQEGKIGLQVHGNGRTIASYKDITIEELP